ncbi:MAG: GNAT family N-acetyltransferase [Gammaproteobacteria bacterium]|nr:GNAT family N-acetyltransferase [Gammaproteobacteria bacterium]
MHVEFADTITGINPEAWNRVSGIDHPFVRHEFLATMEVTGCVGPGTGWQPLHALLYDEQQLVGALPLYEKTDSWGEFVFDFAWANAYHEAGLNYYPKLVSAIPFTPAAGQRILVAPDTDFDTASDLLINAVTHRAKEQNLSSAHILFTQNRDNEKLADKGFLLRKDCQFHWENRDYSDFDDFLAQLRSSKRKKLRRERRRIEEAGVHFKTLKGSEITTELWQDIMPLYASSFLRRGRAPYLNQSFFEHIAVLLPEHLLVIVAFHEEQPIASAICFLSKDTLYGRYWGSAGRYHSLHFETCYYQGIEYCIKHGLQRFEPGTQGEHKIARGFEPVATWSAHWLSHPQFASAIDDYLEREKIHTEEYMEAVRDHVPFKRDQS